MRKRTKIFFMAVVVFFAAFVFVSTLTRAVFYAPDSVGSSSATSTGTPPQPSVSVSAGSPSRLVIPSLNIDAAIQDVGVNAQGNMRAPSNFTDVSWYEYGTPPGALGSAVMAGHVDNGLGLAGVFKNLSQLKIGDDIYIVAKNGVRLHFVVSDVEAYPYTAVPADILFDQNDTARLNLITCEGEWVSGQNTYDHRLVVFSKLQSS